MGYVLSRQFNGEMRLYKALGQFLGIGRSRVRYLLALVGMTHRAKVQHMRWYKTELLNYYIRSNFVVDAKLRKLMTFFLYRIGASGSYKGLRFKRGYPSNGQRTHTNARTVRRQKSKLTVKELRI